GAGMIGLAEEDHARAAHADDRLDHADRDAGLVEAWSLLDVELDVRGDGPRGYLRVRRAVRVEPRSRHRVDEPYAVDGRHLLELRGIEQAAERPRPEEAPVAAFLVAPGRDDQRLGVGRPAFLDRVQALETREHPESPVEDAALRYGVDVRTRQDDRSFRRNGANADRAEDVAGRIHPCLEARRAHLAEQPGTRFFVRRRPAHAGHAAARQGPEPREGIDPRGQSWQRDGDHRGREYKP